MRVFFKFLLIAAILLLGWGVAKILILTKPVAVRKPISVGPPLVEVIKVKPQTEKIKVSAMGTVIPAQEITVVPQVAGEIIEMNPKLIPGGVFKKDELLLKIDDRDYQIALDQRKAELAKAQVNLKTEEGQKAIAEKEWQLLGTGINSDPTGTSNSNGQDLALREPQLKSAQAALKSAQSGVFQAELELQRTEIKAPFYALIKEKYIDLGQFVTTSSKLLSLVGTEEFWVQASLPIKNLPWIFIPGVNASIGSSVSITLEKGNPTSNSTYQGEVLNLLGDLDPIGRMARILISIKDPLSLNNRQLKQSVKSKPSLIKDIPEFPESYENFPLLLDAYVNVEIDGPALENVFVIPRTALRESNIVWTTDEKDENHKLVNKQVEVIWSRKEEFVIRGLQEDDLVITSQISTPVEGMELKISEI